MHQSAAFTKLPRIWQFRQHMKELTTACKRGNQDRYELSRDRKKSTKNSKQTVLTVEQSYEHLPRNSSTIPVNLSMPIAQAYKPLHPKSKQFNRNTIAVSKGTLVKALYTKSNWVFIEITETGAQGFIPISCLNFPPSSPNTENNRVSRSATLKREQSTRLRVTEDYQRQFVGDISVIESEVVTLVDTDEINSDWRLVKRGDGKQGYIPKHILKIDETLSF